MPALRYSRNAGVSVTEVDGEIFIVELASEEVFYLDAVTSGLWRLLSEPMTLSALQETYRAAFPDQDVVKVDQDVAAAVKELLTRKLIVSAP